MRADTLSGWRSVPPEPPSWGATQKVTPRAGRVRSRENEYINNTMLMCCACICAGIGSRTATYTHTQTHAHGFTVACPVHVYYFVLFSWSPLRLTPGTVDRSVSQVGTRAKLMMLFQNGPSCGCAYIASLSVFNTLNETERDTLNIQHDMRKSIAETDMLGSAWQHTSRNCMPKVIPHQYDNGAAARVPKQPYNHHLHYIRVCARLPSTIMHIKFFR